jgi:surface antigen
MGRPLKKDVNGVNVIGTYTGSAGIVVSARLPSQSTAKVGYIVKQTGARTYKITNADGTGKCKLVSSISADGQVVINGYNSSGADATATPIRKLQKRTAVDFSGNRYTWYLTNYADSTGDQIILVPAQTDVTS